MDSSPPSSLLIRGGASLEEQVDSPRSSRMPEFFFSVFPAIVVEFLRRASGYKFILPL